MSKIVELTKLRGIVAEAKKKGKTVVHCHGCFDLVHLGHLRHFMEAKAQGDILVVTLTEDRFVNKGPDRPFFTQAQRLEFLSHVDCIDYVALNQWPTAVETIKLLAPSIYVKGKEYADEKKDISGKIRDEIQAVESVGGRIYYTDDITFSSSRLLNAGMDTLDREFQDFMAAFRERFPFEEIEGQVTDLSKLKVVVVGDTILDQYHFVVPVGMPTKASSVSVRYVKSEIHAGGILAIANHCANFAKQVDLFTLIGDLDDHRDFVLGKLSPNVAPHLFVKPSSYTVTKTRYLDQNQGNRLFEVAHISESGLPADMENEFLERLLAKVREADVVILGDFGHFLVTRTLIEMLQKEAKYLAVNVQTNSLNYGFNTIQKIRKAHYISIDERELRLAFQDKNGPLDELVARALKDKEIDTLSVTLGSKGVLVAARGKSHVRVPACTKTTVDTVGAGDAFLAVSSLVASQKPDLSLVGFVGNVAGAIATRYLGNQSFVERVPYLKFIQTLMK